MSTTPSASRSLRSRSPQHVLHARILRAAMFSGGGMSWRVETKTPRPGAAVFGDRAVAAQARRRRRSSMATPAPPKASSEAAAGSGTEL